MSADYVTHDEFELRFSKLDSKMDARFQHLEYKIDNVESKLQTHIDVLNATLSREMKNAHDIFATKAELFGMETRLIKWMVGTMLASTGLAATIAFGLVKLMQ